MRARRGFDLLRGGLSPAVRDVVANRRIEQQHVLWNHADLARYFGEKMLDEGLVHILATDAHSVRHRAPLLTEGREAAAKRVGADEAQRLVVDRPQAILDNHRPGEVAPVRALRDTDSATPRRGFFSRFVGRGRDIA